MMSTTGLKMLVKAARQARTATHLVSEELGDLEAYLDRYGPDDDPLASPQLSDAAAELGKVTLLLDRAMSALQDLNSTIG